MFIQCESLAPVLVLGVGFYSVFITLLTKLLVMTVPTLWTYPLNRFVIHRKKKAKVEPLPESADTPAGAAA